MVGSVFQAEETFQVALISSQNSRDELLEINQEIDKLTNQRNLYLAKATRLQNQGDRLQFENNNLIDARRAWQQAQIHREIATRIQEEIDILEKRKQKLLQESSNAPLN
jgi:FtsZ-binding cell division protein ZapB